MRRLCCCFQREPESNIFGVCLEKLWERHQGEPVFFAISMDVLHERALKEARLFRDEPEMSEYLEFVNMMENGDLMAMKNGDNMNMMNMSALSTAWFLRMFLFYLPIPLIPNEYGISKRLLNAMDSKMPDIFEQLLITKSLIISLKSEYLHILQSVIRLFAAISCEQMKDGLNGLDAHHLAQMFGPILIGLKLNKSTNSTNSQQLRLSQDLALFLINHYHDIFDRNTFKELVFIHGANKELLSLQNEHKETIESLQRLRSDITNKLCKSHYDLRLSSRSFLSWKASIPRIQTERKQFLKLQQLTHSMAVSNQIIQKQTKKIRALETKLELNTFDRRLSGI